MNHTVIHMISHFVVPLLVAGVVTRTSGHFSFLKITLLLLASMAIDIDHLLATPVFDPDRCSIGFHPLHSWPAIGVYLGLGVALVVSGLKHPAVLAAKWVVLGIGIHIVLDGIDCYFI